MYKMTASIVDVYVIPNSNNSGELALFFFYPETLSKWSYLVIENNK